MKQTEQQLCLPFETAPGARKPLWEAFPQTRYLGSKRKLLTLLSQVFKNLEFETALDPFSGTASVAYLLKCALLGVSGILTTLDTTNGASRCHERPPMQRSSFGNTQS